MKERREQLAEVYIAGMPEHASKACERIQARITEGWLVEHMLSLSSGMILVVYSNGGSLVDTEETYRQWLTRTAGS